MADDLNRQLYLARVRGLSQSEIGRKFKLTRSAANGRAIRHQSHIEHDNRDLEICKAIDAGRTDSEIGRDFEVSRQHVAGLRAALEEL